MQKSNREHTTPKWETPRTKSGDELPTMTPQPSGLPSRTGRSSTDADGQAVREPNTRPKLPVLRTPERTPWDQNVSVQELVQLPIPSPLFPFEDKHGSRGQDEPILKILRRRAGVFVGISLIVWLAMGAYLTFVPRKYVATSLLIVDTRGFRDSVEELPRLSTESAALSVSKIANHALILQSSQKLATSAADQIIASNDGINATLEFTVLRDLDVARDRILIIERLREDYVIITPEPNDDDEPDAITINVTSTNPDEAAAIANMYAESYIASVNSTTDKQFSEARQYYQSLFDAEEATLTGFEQQLHDYSTTNNEFVLREEATHILRQISLLRSKLDDARIEISERQASIASLRSRFENFEPQLIAEQKAGGLGEEIKQTNRKIASLELQADQFYSKNPELRENPEISTDLVNILQELKSLRDRSSSLSESYISEVVAVGGIDLQSLESGVSQMAELRRRIADEDVLLSSSLARESAILTRLAEYEQMRTVIPSQSADLRQIKQGHGLSLSRHTELNEILIKLDVSERSRRVFAEIISAAIVPTKSTPNPHLTGILGIILGLLLGVGGAFARDRTDSRIFQPKDIRPTNVDVIGTIPRFKNSKGRLWRSKKTVSFYERQISPYLICLTKPQSVAAHAFRTLMMRLNGDGAEMQTFVISSAESNAGKSLIASNFAITLAQSGYRTLLINADLYHPSVVELFGLSQQAEFDLETCTFSDGQGVEAFSVALPHLFALSLTGPTDGRAEFLMSTNLVPLIERVRRHFDVIVIDTPPLTNSTDALRLAQFCDETILVARIKQTKSEIFEKVIKDVERASGKSVRVILNEFRSSTDAIYDTYETSTRNVDREPTR